MPSPTAQLLFDVVNRAISETEFHRGVAEHEHWRVEAQPLAGGGALPLISADNGLGTVRVFTDTDAVKRWLAALGEDRARPVLTAVGADLFGGMPPAVQQVVFDAGGPLTIRVLPPKLDELRELSTAVRVERLLQRQAQSFLELAQTLFQHHGYYLVTEADGRVALAHGRALAFTAVDAAERYVIARGEQDLGVTRMPAKPLFQRLAEVTGVDGLMFNVCGPGPRLGLRPDTIASLADVEYVP